MSGGPRRRSRWLTTLVLLVAGGGLAAYALRPKPPLEVDTALVDRGQVREVIASAASGEVKPARRVTVRAEIPGTVRAVNKARGDRVAKDEVLVTFASDELAVRLEQAKANLATAEVAIRGAAVRRDSAQRAVARARTLSGGGAIAPAELDRAEAELEAAEVAAEQAKSAREQAAVAVKLARVALDRTEVRAPFAGVLNDVSAELGVQLAPGAALFDLIDDREIYVEVPIDEGDAAKVSVGQRVSLETDAVRASAITGVVRYIPPAVGRPGGGAGAGLLDGAGAAGAATAGRRDRFLYLEVVPTATAASSLRVGASVNAELLVRAKPDVVRVPTHAVVGRGVERQVWTIVDGRARTLRFKAGLTSWEHTEVLSGLAPGTLLIASLNAKGLVDGARVVARGP